MGRTKLRMAVVFPVSTHNDVLQKTGVREMPGFVDGLEYDGRKPSEYLNSFEIGLKDDPSLPGR